MKYIILNDNKYELIENYKDAFNLEELEEAFTEFFNIYDYIVGDYAYSKLRLKGFCDLKNKKLNKVNNYNKKNEYLKEYCAYECKYFILEKIKWGKYGNRYNK